MEIDHVSFSSSGGAGLVAESLASHQTLLGHDSKLISYLDKNLHEKPMANLPLTLAAYGDAQLVRSTSTKTMVSLYRNDFHLLRHEHLRVQALLNIHWNQGVISSSSVLSLLKKGKPVVWTLHDMAPFTGVCHHNNGCVGFQAACRDCPQVRPIFQNRVMRSLADKAKFDIPNEKLCVVAPSKWMSVAARESRVFGNQRVEVIQNPINTAFFEKHSKDQARRRLSITDNALVGATLATRLNDPGKRVEELLVQFLSAARKYGKPAKYLLFGAGGEKLVANYPEVIYLGPIALEEIPQHLVAADFLGTFSLAESEGMTVREAGALAIPSISFSNLGAREQINHMHDGMLFDDIGHFQQILLGLFEGKLDLRSLGINAQKRSNSESKPEVAAKNYLDLYSEML